MRPFRGKSGLGHAPQPVGAERERRRAAEYRLVDSEEIVVRERTDSAAGEAFLRLRTTLKRLGNAGSPQVIVVTSSLPREGKSLTAINLALAFAGCEKGRILLIDADLRRSGIRRFVRPVPAKGLTELLAARASLADVLVPLADAKLDLIFSGRPAENPVGLLSSDVAKQLIHGMRNRYDRIVIDAPPVAFFADGRVLGEYGDGVLLVARSGVTPKSLLERMVGELSPVGLLGVVLNDVAPGLADRREGYAHGYYDEYYQRGREE